MVAHKSTSATVAFWAIMKKYNIGATLIPVSINVHGKATSAVLFNSSIGNWLRTTGGVRQECLLSSTFFNIFKERITTDALEDHEGTISIGGRTITNLLFADDMDGLAGEEEELAKLGERLDEASTACGMEISAEKTNNISGINTEINDEIRAKIQQAIRPHEDVLAVLKRHKLHWYGHVSRSSGLAKTIL